MPQQYTLHICAFLCFFCIESAFGQATTQDILPQQNGQYYIYITTYDELKPISYFNKFGLTDVKYYNDVDGLHRFYSGPFDGKGADVYFKKAIKSGFQYAKIVSVEEDKIAAKLHARKNTYRFYEITYDELFLRSVLFEFNSDRLDEKAEQLLHEVYMIMVRNPDWIAQLSGHSDSIGSSETNIKISKKRVRSVKNRLLKYGIQSERIKTRVFGEAAPIAKNVETGRKLNRRVCIGIYNERGELVNIKDSMIVPFNLELGN